MTAARLFQLAFVTDDIERGQDLLAARFGVDDFGTLGEMTLINTQDEPLTFEARIAWLHDLELELIEPRGGFDALYRDGLPADGSSLALHHVGYLLDTHEAVSAMQAQVDSHGMPVPLSGRRGTESAFFYADARPLVGHFLEYLYLSPERLDVHRHLPPAR
jgi:Glyoxalase/Bleomycin resistance protein/Dioxygenase superfamily